MPLAIFFLLITLTAGGMPAHAGQRESDAHRSRSPSDKFRGEHYKDGDHVEDLDHQAIIGSKHDAKEFDQLSPEESKHRLRLLAMKMDVNGDGQVEKSELTDWIHKSMNSLDMEETDERFDELDSDKDRFITWEEYVKDAFGDADDDGKLSTDTEDLKLMEEDRGYFTAADLNKDNKLDREEFAAFQNPEHHEHMHDMLIQVTLNEKDTNKNGKIEYNEFIGEIGGSPDSEYHKAEKVRFEQEYDQNKDGVLDTMEVRKWLIPDTKQTAQEEMEHLFSTADKDNNGKLTYDEIVQEHQLFVGSEATNYGEHLESIHEEL